MTWAVKQQLPALQKLVLLMLANRTNADNGRCDPSISRVAEDCGMSKDSVRRAITALADAGFLTVLQRQDGTANLSNHYLLNLQGVVAHSDQGSRSQQGGVVAHSHPKQEDQTGRETEITRERKSSPDSDLFGQGSKSCDGVEDSIPPEPAAPPSKAKRATRLPEDFEVPEDWHRAADASIARAGIAQGLVNHKAESIQFVNYWVGRADKGGAKADWKRTYINRCIETAQRAQRFARPQTPFGSVRPPTQGQVDRFAGRMVDDTEKIKRQNAEASQEMDALFANSTRPRSATR